MARDISGLRRGGPGRPKGSPNKITREMKEWASGLLHSKKWRASAEQRILAGEAPQLEAHILQVILPKTDRLQVTTTLEELIAGANR